MKEVFKVSEIKNGFYLEPDDMSYQWGGTVENQEVALINRIITLLGFKRKYGVVDVQEAAKLENDKL